MKKIVIVGVGALGSHVALFLRNLDFQRAGQGDTFKLVLIDYDRIEQKNTLSQFHARSHVGKNKAQSFVQSLNFLFGIKVEGIPHKLTKDNARELLGGATLVLDCLDNGASRRLVQTFTRELQVPCVHGALSADGVMGRVVWDDKFNIDDESAEGAATCEDGAHLPFIALVSAQLARSAQEFLQTGRQLSHQIVSRGSSILL